MSNANLTEVATSASGANIPSLGFGTYGMTGDGLRRVLGAAFEAGIRHVDTGQLYGNESEVGDAVAAAGHLRGEIFVTTKISPHSSAPSQFVAAVEESLAKLRVDVIDLLLIHWPRGGAPIESQMRSLGECVRRGLVRYGGVSNFNRALLARAIGASEVPLVTNQIEIHPFLDARRIVAATRASGLTVTAYCPLAIGRVLHDEDLRSIAEKHRRSIPQVVLRWVIERDGFVALTRTARPERLRENVAVFDFRLDEDDTRRIDALIRPGSRIVNPPGLAPAWDD